ncbi:unnamed protein product [Arctia plantaginis]|uniref:RNA-directed RNA polymerase C-terminal domain-containing protein n=1 Tax=Arctia plantaginis TaxID=874455 RepID=A0A8S1ANX9_ARCPL|nr:unnamed protein product [Arctia plantaginis]
MSSQPKIIGNSDSKSDRQLKKYKDIMSYRNDATENEHNLLYRAAIVRVYDASKRKEGYRVPMVHLVDLLSKDSTMVDWSESSGLPWCEMKYDTKGQIRDDPEAIRQVRKFWHLVKDGDDVIFPDCLVHTQNNKTAANSTVWTYPATVNFGEAVFTVGLLKAFSEQGDLGVMAYEYISSADGRDRLRNRLHQQDRFFIRLNFDENSVPSWVIHEAFRILWSHIDFKQYAGGGVPDAEKMFRMLECIENYFINTTIKLPNGLRLMKSCGIPRGSYFTLLVSSVVSLILLEYLSLHIDGTYTEDSVANGNECIARISSYWDLDLCQRVIKKEFGITFNAPQCQMSKNIKCIHFFKNT